MGQYQAVNQGDIMSPIKHKDYPGVAVRAHDYQSVTTVDGPGIMRHSITAVPSALDTVLEMTCQVNANLPYKNMHRPFGIL